MKRSNSSAGETTPQKHRNLREPWKPGESGNPNGRPRGSRHKLSEVFLGDLYETWREHGRAAIKEMISKNPGDFVKVVASLVPRQLEMSPSDPFENMDDDELEDVHAILKAALAEREAALEDGKANERSQKKKATKIN